MFNATAANSLFAIYTSAFIVVKTSLGKFYVYNFTKYTEGIDEICRYDNRKYRIDNLNGNTNVRERLRIAKVENISPGIFA